jgi:hypothetical protein
VKWQGNREKCKPRIWELAAIIVCLCGVEWAITLFEPYRTPSSDGISPILLQEGLVTLLGSLFKVFRASIALIHVLQSWRFTKVVFMSKPGKNGYIKDKYFRSISLTSFLLNILERLVDGFLKNRQLLERFLAASQYTFWAGRFSETALHHFMSKLVVQQKAKEMQLAAFFILRGLWIALLWKQ